MGIKTKLTLIISVVLASTLATGCILEAPVEDTGHDTDGEVIIDPVIDAPQEIGNGFVQPYGIRADGSYLFIASHLERSYREIVRDRAWELGGAEHSAYRPARGWALGWRPEAES